MKLDITFPGGSRVDAHIHGQTVPTDQPIHAGGDGSAAAPYTIFLASLGTCAGYFVQAFCKSRGLSTAGIRIVQHVEKNPDTGLAGHIRIDVEVPGDFPQKYHAALIRAAAQCSVKRSLEQPPTVETAVHVAATHPGVVLA